jgi:ferredoxin
VRSDAHQRGGGKAVVLKVHFISPDGETTQTVEAKSGENLLEIAQNAGQPLEGTCEGQMACSTCHVIIDKSWFDKLPPLSEDEEDMLDLASGARRTSRLSCQIELSDELDGLVVHIPAESRNMQGV